MLAIGLLPLLALLPGVITGAGKVIAATVRAVRGVEEAEEETEPPPAGALPFSAVEHQRAQAAAAVSHGTVTGGVTASVTTAKPQPDTPLPTALPTVNASGTPRP